MTAAQGPLGAEDLAYRARALAQAHPLTPLAKRYLDHVVAEQRMSQPVAEIGIWAGAALLNGYCLRRVEEVEAGLELEPDQDNQPDIEPLDEAATRVAADLRADDAEAAARHLLGEEERTVEALDRIIASEVSRRLDHWAGDIEPSAWAELEEYLTWWVVKGYALRVAETAIGAVR